MNNKVVFIDNSKLAGSVVKILARNIMMMTDDSVNMLKVVHLDDLQHFHFTNETLVLVDPLVPLDHFLLKRYIPRRIKVKTFNIGAYSSLGYHEILEQINNPDRSTTNNLFKITFLKGLFKKKSPLT